MNTIICRFSCDLCGLDKIEVEVPTRPVALDVVAWMQGVLTRYLVTKHHQLSPQCHPKTLSKVMIPISDEQGNEAPHIGAAVRKKNDSTPT